MNYDPQFAAVCGDARLPSQRMARLFKIGPPPQPRDDLCGDSDAQTHVPWPDPERMGMRPWPPQLLDGLLGSDGAGFRVSS